MTYIPTASPSLAAFQRTGQPAATPPYYQSPTNAGAFGTFTPWPQNTLVVRPYIAGPDRVIDSMSMKVSVAAGAGSQARFGIYKDNGNMYPGSLLLDAGVVAIDTTGLKEITGLNTKLPGNALYWLAHLLNIPSGAVTFFVNTPANQLDVIGVDPVTANQGVSRIDVAQAFGALPTPYPGGGTYNSAGYPLVFLKFSS